ncbi:ficolin-1-like [Scylla paramamosain]|uniref:ficolin-1-like n=1 Tax=Scylla paramamosain TaxID=85552 RepID=UPI003082C593
MLLILLSALCFAVAEHTTPIPAPPNIHSSFHVYPSLLSNLLQIAGYSDTCVAASLDACSAASEDTSLSALIQEVREVVRNVSLLVNRSESRPRHCKDLLDSGDSGSGLRLVYPYPAQPHHRVKVYCDHTTDGGGWTVFQRRTDDAPRQDFYRTWIEYKLGFGDLDGEFWLGLEHLHSLTSTTLQQLKIHMSDYEGAKRWAQYGFFHVDSAVTKYRLSVGRYSGDAGDSLGSHHTQRFSTHDQDNDVHDTINCAEKFRGAWWFSSCHASNLNGYQHRGNHSSHADGINWYSWHGWNYSLRRTSMMIRPAF